MKVWIKKQQFTFKIEVWYFPKGQFLFFMFVQIWHNFLFMFRSFILFERTFFRILLYPLLRCIFKVHFKNESLNLFLQHLFVNLQQDFFLLSLTFFVIHKSCFWSENTNSRLNLNGILSNFFCLTFFACQPRTP